MTHNKTALDVEVGDVVLQEAFGGTRRIVTVTEIHANMKNGKPGFSGTADILGEPFPVWGYCEQIVRYISHAR